LIGSRLEVELALGKFGNFGQFSCFPRKEGPGIHGKFGISIIPVSREVEKSRKMQALELCNIILPPFREKGRIVLPELSKA